MNETYGEYIEWTGGDPDPNIKKSYEKAQERLKELLVYEDKLVRYNGKEQFGCFCCYWFLRNSLAPERCGSSSATTVKSLIEVAPNHKTYMFLVSSCSCLCAIYQSHVSSWEWRCSRSNADRRCSNYIWVINNLISYKGMTYIRDMKVHF